MQSKNWKCYIFGTKFQNCLDIDPFYSNTVQKKQTIAIVKMSNNWLISMKLNVISVNMYEYG